MNKENTFTQIRTLFAIEGDWGFSEVEMQPLLEKAGTLPAVLYDYYRTLGKHEALNHTQDRLIAPNWEYQYFPTPHPDYFVFYKENQSVCFWAIAKEEALQENPKVYISFDNKNWQVECETLSEFLLAMAHLQAVFALPYAYERFKYITPKELEMIQEHFPQKPFALRHWVEGVTFYGGDTDSIVVMGGGEQLIYASSNKTSFEAMDSFLENIGEEM